MEEQATNYTPFATIYRFFDDAVIGVIQSGTTSMIELITPLITAGFGLYMLLIFSSYWRGTNEDHVTDFLLKMVGWSVVIMLGLNVNNYSLYVVPFVNGLGDDLALAVGENNNSALALDAMFNGLLSALLNLAKSSTFSTAIHVAITGLLMSVTGVIFLMIAVGYIIMAKLALGILIAIGPFFISAALFPATRKLFEAWMAQCLNYALITMLFSFAAQLQLRLLTSLIPTDLTFTGVINFVISCAVMIFVSLNLPNLASSLAGGITILSMTGKVGHGVGKVGSGVGMATRLFKKRSGKGNSDNERSSSNENKPQPEQK